MSRRVFVVLVLSLLAFAWQKPEARVGAEEQEIDAQQDFRKRLEGLAKSAPDAYLAPSPTGKDWDARDTEYRLFSRGADIIVQALNTASANQESAKERTSDALTRLETVSNKVNADWPEENRFHFEILDLPPALAVKMTIRTSATFFVFGVPEKDASGKPNLRWERIGADDVLFQQDPARSLVELFALHRGPSGNARFLARIEPSGCAGSIGVVYDGREWDAHGTGKLYQIIGQTGALGLDDQVPGFEWVGHLQTEGQLVTLPYCHFSAIDTWDNPSLCAVDTYDLSADDVKFRSRIYNRPDLVPIAKVIEYTQKHDYPAVLAYCATAQVADNLIREISPDFFAEDIQVTDTGNGSERVTFADGTVWFDVKQQNGRWLVAAFRSE